MTFTAQRILILGNSGAGKTTLARRLATRTGLPLIHLDQHYWQPGWRQLSEPKWREKVTQLIASPQWIMDGNYSGTWNLKLPAADLVIYLDYNRWRVTAQMLWRYLRYRGQNRPDVATGCPEPWSCEFFEYVWYYHERKRPGQVERLQTEEAGEKLLIFSTPREAHRWLVNL
ncbi:MAG: adenylate kinase [Bacteroidetes bacterium]|nr:MAG: adenylate kinase [Bacteroidota bacterium]